MIHYRKGGMIYRQVGGPTELIDGQPAEEVLGAQGAPVPPMDPGMAPPAGPPMDPAMAPPPPAPAAPPRKSFAEKVAEAKQMIQGNAASGQPLPTMDPAYADPMMDPMMDGQGDGPIMGDATLSEEEVGPDLGEDTVDAKLTPGEFVVNKEAMENPEDAAAVEAINNKGRAIQQMRGGGIIARGFNEGGKVGAIERLMANPNLSEANRMALEKVLPEYRKFGGEATPFYKDDRLGQLGESLVAIGQRDFKGASEALRPRESTDDETKSRAQNYRESIDAATKAKQFIDQGASEILDYRSNNYSDILQKALSTYSSESIVALGEAWRGEKEAAIDTVLHGQFAGTKQWNAYEAYIQEIRILQLKARSLVKGGSISDSEAKAAAETIVTGRADAKTIQQQLDTVINRNNEGLKSIDQPAYTSSATAFTVTGNPYQEDKTVNLNSEGVEVTPENLQEGQRFTSSDATGTYEYETIVKDGKGYVRTSTGDYELYYDKGLKQWFIEGSTGKSILTVAK